MLRFVQKAKKAVGSQVGPDPKAILKIQFLGGHCSDSKNISVVLSLCLEICHPSKQPTSQKRKLRLGEEVGPTQGPITEAKLPWGRGGGIGCLFHEAE